MYKIAVFDMDGTLIRNTDSVKLLCDLNGADESVMDEILQREEAETITWIEADFERAKLFKGLDVRLLEEKFDGMVEIIGGLEYTISVFKENNILPVLVTGGPIQVAEIVARLYF